MVTLVELWTYLMVYYSQTAMFEHCYSGAGRKWIQSEVLKHPEKDLWMCYSDCWASWMGVLSEKLVLLVVMHYWSASVWGTSLWNHVLFQVVATINTPKYDCLPRLWMLLLSNKTKTLWFLLEKHFLCTFHFCYGLREGLFSFGKAHVHISQC